MHDKPGHDAMTTSATTLTAPPRLVEQADDEQAVPFGRNKMLKLLGGVLFGAVSGSILKANPAWASHQGPPGPCFGYQKCHSCVGSTCNLVTCGYYNYLGCPSGGQCWQSCYSNCTWNCCDWEFTSGSTWQKCLCGVCISGTSC